MNFNHGIAIVVVSFAGIILLLGLLDLGLELFGSAPLPGHVQRWARHNPRSAAFLLLVGALLLAHFCGLPVVFSPNPGF